MYSGLCMCDVCTKGRLFEWETKNREKKKKKNENKEKKRSKARGCALSMSLGYRLVPQGSVPPWT